MAQETEGVLCPVLKGVGHTPGEEGAQGHHTESAWLLDKSHLIDLDAPLGRAPPPAATTQDTAEIQGEGSVFIPKGLFTVD